VKQRVKLDIKEAGR